MRSVKVFDSTLSLGALLPGFSISMEEKYEIARQLEKMQVDIIELGFPIAGDQEFNTVKTIAGKINQATVAANARTLSRDIEKAAEALKDASSPLLHIFMAASAEQIHHKLRMTEEAALNQAVESVKLAKKYCGMVEFTADDAFQADQGFLVRLTESVIAAGATIVNYSDTKGLAVPSEFKALLEYIQQNVKNIDKADLSVHARNDLGLATANTLAAVEAGADQIKTTVIGIGNRAGNAPLEEVLLALRLNPSLYPVDVRADISRIYRVTRLVSSIAGMNMTPLKPIVGDNIFSAEQFDEKSPETAESEGILTPKLIGMTESSMPLGKITDRPAFQERLHQMGYHLEEKEFIKAFNEFKILVNKKKNIQDKDIEALLEDKTINIPEMFVLENYMITSSNTISSTCAISLILEDGEVKTQVGLGEGPIDAAFLAINQIVGDSFSLSDYHIRSVTEGQDAQGEVTVKIRRKDKIYAGRGLSTDIIEASLKAYLNAINKMYYDIRIIRGES